jgi:hypothetical protein
MGTRRLYTSQALPPIRRFHAAHPGGCRRPGDRDIILHVAQPVPFQLVTRVTQVKKGCGTGVRHPIPARVPGLEGSKG